MKILHTNMHNHGETFMQVYIVLLTAATLTLSLGSVKYAKCYQLARLAFKAVLPIVKTTPEGTTLLKSKKKCIKSQLTKLRILKVITLKQFFSG